MEWHHSNSPWKNEFNSTPSAVKVMAAVFFSGRGWRGLQKWLFSWNYSTCSNYLTQIGTFKLLKPCRSVLNEFDLTKMSLL
jgi:hypothetical protein